MPRRTNHPTSTAAKRAAIAARLQTTAAEIGVSYTREDLLGDTIIRLSRDGRHVMVWLDETWPGAYLGHWHSDPGLPGLPRGFHASVGSCSPHPSKATSCDDTLDELLSHIREGFASLTEADMNITKTTALNSWNRGRAEVRARYERNGSFWCGADSSDQEGLAGACYNYNTPHELDLGRMSLREIRAILGGHNDWSLSPEGAAYEMGIAYEALCLWPRQSRTITA